MKNFKIKSKATICMASPLLTKDKTPKSELEDFKSKTFLISTLRPLDFTAIKFDSLPPLDSAKDEDFKPLFMKKCKECFQLCDFSDEKIDTQSKQLKTGYLMEFETIFTKPRFFRNIDDEMVLAFVKMSKINISRALPAFKVISTIDCPDNVFDISWPHLNLVYSDLKAFFSSKLMSKLKSDQIVSLMNIFLINTYSSDERERQSVKDCLSLLYSKINENDSKKSVIKSTFNRIELGKTSAELLGFIYDIVTDIPTLFPEQLLQLYTAVLSLHNSPLFMKFSGSLSSCITRFIRTKRTLLEPTILFLVNHWPKAGIRKQVNITSELESIMQNFAEQPISRNCATALFQKLGALFVEPGVDVAEAALSFVIGQGNEATLIEYIDLAMKLLIPSLCACKKKHWNIFIQDDANIVLDLLSKVNPPLYTNTLQEIIDNQKTQKINNKNRTKTWALITEMAKKNNPDFTSDKIKI